MGVEPAVFQSVRKNAQPALRAPHASPANRVAWGEDEQQSE